MTHRPPYPILVAIMAAAALALPSALPHICNTPMSPETLDEGVLRKVSGSARQTFERAVKRRLTELSELRGRERAILGARRFVKARLSREEPPAGRIVGTSTPTGSRASDRLRRDSAASSAPVLRSSATAPVNGIRQARNHSRDAARVVPRSPMSCPRLIVLDDRLIENLQRQNQLLRRNASDLRAIVDVYQAEVGSLREGMRHYRKEHRRDRILTGLAVVGSFAVGVLAASR